MEEFAPGRVGFLTQTVWSELLCSWVKMGREIVQRETRALLSGPSDYTPQLNSKT